MTNLIMNDNFCILAELTSSVQEQRHQSEQAKVVRTQFHSTLAENESWLTMAAQATSHHRDDTSDSISQAILVSL